jgi:hypothetical protein
MKKLFYIVLVTIMSGMVACVEPPIGQTPVDSVAPPAIDEASINIVPKAGGAVITYELPRGVNDLSYVKCEYTFNGEPYVVRASIYVDSLVIEGIGNEDPIDVTLYLVDHSENVSPGVTKNFKPETPPWVAIYESLAILPDFGGVSVSWVNETETEIGVIIYSEDSITGEFREGAAKYYKDREVEVKFIGYDFVPTRFAALIMDRWGNISPMKDTIVTPLYEVALDKLKWRALELPGDNNTSNNGRALANAWNNNYAYSNAALWVSGGDFGPYPEYFTIDLGEVVKFSRMKLWPRARSDYYYNTSTFRTFECWGATEYVDRKDEYYWRYDYDPNHLDPNRVLKTDIWKNDGHWEKLGDFEVKRPSGNTSSTQVPEGEDLAFGQAGYSFDVSYKKKPLRYIRFAVTDTWGASSGMMMVEFDFWGDNGTGPVAEEPASE